MQEKERDEVLYSRLICMQEVAIDQTTSDRSKKE